MKLVQLTLEKIEPWRRRKAIYQTVFRGQYGSDLLADLAKFCCAFDTTAPAGADRDVVLLNEGKRLVWLRIMEFLHLNPEELALVYRNYMEEE